MAQHVDSRHSYVPIHSLVGLTASVLPSHAALIEGSLSVSYEAMNMAANRVSNALLSSGMSLGTHVGICIPRSAHAVIAVLGVLRAGGVYVPIDPRFPRVRRDFIAADSEIKLCLVSEASAGLFSSQIREVLIDGDAVKSQSSDDPCILVGPEDAAYLVYTSGTTGAPNGVIGLHRGITYRTRELQRRYPMTSDDIGSHKTSLSYFDSGGEIFWPLSVGAPVVIISEETGRDPLALVRELEVTGVTRLVAVPSLLKAMLDVVSSPSPSPRLESLRYIHSSGEILPETLAMALIHAFPRARLINLYGCSEVSADVSLHDVSKLETVNLGKPLDGATIRLLDGQLHEVEQGGVGEICVGGEPVARGYHRRPSLTSERFIRDPLLPDSLLFRTGDRGRWNTKNELEFLGRLDDQVKVRGHRIELAEVEAAIRSSPLVAEAAAVVLGSGPEARLGALVVPAPASSEDVAAYERGEAWRRLYLSLYRAIGTGSNDRDSVWTDSYSGEPFDSATLAAWVEAAVSRVRAWNPSSILDIGCGTGNLILPLARGRRIVGTDFSEDALAGLRSELHELDLDHVQLLAAESDDLKAVDGERFDAVVLHSVVQYLPDQPSLERTVEAAIDHLAPGGRLLVGDVRDLTLLRLQHQHRLKATGKDYSQESVDAALASEQELVVDPRFFVAIAQRRGLSCDVHVKRMVQHNELSRFRYDVVIWAQAESENLDEAIVIDAPASIAALRRELVLAGNRSVQISEVLDERLATVLGLSNGFDPETVRLLGESLGRRTSVLVGPGRSRGAMLVRFDSPEGKDFRTRWPECVWEHVDAKSLTNQSGDLRKARPVDEAQLLSELRLYVRSQLPGFMVPTLRLTDRLPRSSNGKLDRNAVSRHLAIEHRRQAYDPRLGTVAQAWMDVLGSGDISTDVNFFDAGGSSLSLVRLHLKLSGIAGIEFPLVDLYEHVTIQMQQAYLQRLVDTAASSPEDEEGQPWNAAPREFRTKPRRQGIRRQMETRQDLE